MRLPFLVICLAAFWIFSAAAAEDKYTFGPVPSPSKFSTDVSLPPAKIEPAKPVVAPTNSVEPAKPIFQPVEAKAESAPSNFKPVEPAVQPILPKVEPVTPPRASGKLIVEAGGGLDGKVVVVDAQRYFVVLNFPLGQMPPVNAALNVYRHGVKVGELSVTGPQRDDSIVADIVSGELQVGDSARNR